MPARQYKIWASKIQNPKESESALQDLCATGRAQESLINSSFARWLVDGWSSKPTQMSQDGLIRVRPDSDSDSDWDSTLLDARKQPRAARRGDLCAQSEPAFTIHTLIGVKFSPLAARINIGAALESQLSILDRQHPRSMSNVGAKLSSSRLNFH